LTDKEHAQDPDILLMYDQDDSAQLVAAVEEMLVELGFQNHFVHED
jgi:hypothetical protein